MKKIFVFVIAVFTVMPLAAQSTCETRVDKHQKATTKQRVAYCLTPETTPVEQNNTELIYYGVSSAKPQEETVTPSKNKNPYFYQDKVDVSRGFVGTERFPKFVNDTLSEEELAALQVHQAQYDAHGAVKPTRTNGKAVAGTLRETQKGIAHRQQKPARYITSVMLTEETVVLPPDPQEEDQPQTHEMNIAAEPQEIKKTEPALNNIGGFPVLADDYDALPQTNPYSLDN